MVYEHRKQKIIAIPTIFFCFLENKSYICTVKQREMALANSKSLNYEKKIQHYR